MNTYHLYVRNPSGGQTHIEVKARNMEDLAGKLTTENVEWNDTFLIMTSSEYWRAYDRSLKVMNKRVPVSETS